MITHIDQLLSRYESGRLNRREFIVALSAMAAAPTTADTPAAPLNPVTLNHVTLAVSNVERSREFYQNILNMPVVSRQKNGINLGAGPQSFLGLYSIPKVSPSIHHFCLGVKPFQVEAAVESLARHDVKASVRDRDGVKELYFRDPDGITGQLQGDEYRG